MVDCVAFAVIAEMVTLVDVCYNVPISATTNSDTIKHCYNLNTTETAANQHSFIH